LKFGIAINLKLSAQHAITRVKRLPGEWENIFSIYSSSGD
jgi:hypothetical protein